MKARLSIRDVRKGRNELERAYSMRLASRLQTGEILWWDYEPFRLRIGKGAWYRPDHAVLELDGSMVLVEVKGFWREAARVRIKVAAERYPMFRFCAVTRERGGAWKTEEFTV